MSSRHNEPSYVIRTQGKQSSEKNIILDSFTQICRYENYIHHLKSFFENYQWSYVNFYCAIQPNKGVNRKYRPQIWRTNSLYQSYPPQNIQELNEVEHNVETDLSFSSLTLTVTQMLLKNGTSCTIVAFKTRVDVRTGT